MFEARIAIVERHMPVESLIELDFGAREAQTTTLGRDPEAATFPLHDVVMLTMRSCRNEQMRSRLAFTSRSWNFLENS